MKKALLAMLLLASTSSVFARTHCIEQAQKIAEVAFEESLKGEQVEETQVEQIGGLSWEFTFAQSEKKGTKIKVIMIPQADPGTHCEISKLTAKNY